MDKKTDNSRDKNDTKKPFYWKKYNEMEQKNKKYTESQRRKMDNHGKWMELSMWMDEFMYQIAKGSRKEYCKKTINQRMQDTQDNNG